jgi:ABC-type branched-subunit amino acid transport system substrate-binding protein
VRALLVFAAAALSACSALQVDYASCTADSQCREAFGRGWGCEEASGHCAEVAPDPRCDSYPAGILEDPAAHEDRVLIGSVFQQGPDFNGMVRSARLAVIQVNDRGGIDGTPVGILECNSADADGGGAPYGDGMTPEEATVATGNYLSDIWGVSAIVGPATSGRALLAYNAWSQRGTLLISPSATSPELTAADGLEATHEDPGLLWRTAPPDSFQGALLASMAIADGRSDVGVLSQTGPYGDGLADVFSADFDGGGRSSTKYPFTTPTDLAEQITAAAAAGHDALLVVSSDTPDIIRFFNSAAGVASLHSIRIFLPDGAFSESLLADQDGVTSEARDLLFPNVQGTVPGLPRGPAFTNFTTLYRAVNNGEDPTVLPFTANAYDAAWLALSGYSWAAHNEGGISGIGAARGLLEISDPSFGTPLEIGPGSWTNIQSNFTAGRSIDVQGASGPLDYGDDGETVGPIDIWDLDLVDEEWELHRWCCLDVSPSPTQGCVGTLSACADHD